MKSSITAEYVVESERVCYRRYVTVLDRRVTFTLPQGQTCTFDYDIVGHPKANYKFVVVFPFTSSRNGTGGEVTVVKEYAQGPNQYMYTLPCGGFDPSKHKNLEECAKSELSEEAKLKGGELLCLIPPDCEGISEVKWSQNHFKPYLAIDPVADPTPGTRDPEEIGVQVLRMSIPELMEVIYKGQMLLPSVTTSFMAIEELRRRKLV